MEPGDYLRSIRRRPLVIIAAVAVALGTAWATSEFAPPESPTQSYEATAVLLATGQPPGLTEPLPGAVTSGSTVAALTTQGPVPERAADAVGYAGDPQDLVASVSANVDKASGLLRITATSTEPQEAKILAESFSEELLDYLKERQRRAIAAQKEFIGNQLKDVQQEIGRLSDRGTSVTGGLNDLILERDALRDRREQLFGSVPTAGWEIIQDPRSQAIEATGIQAPTSLPIRLGIGLLLGLLAGVATALVLDRLDDRIRTKQDAEEQFSRQVLAEIPPLRRRDRKVVVTATHPNSPPAEAFRLLGAELARGVHDDRNGRGGWNGSGSHEAPRTILVTSPGPREGKTTVTANLAATLAEMGKRVILLSCDFRRPGIDRLFGIQNEKGLAAALRSANGSPVLPGIVRQTGVPGIRAVPSGKVSGNPSTLLSSANMRRAMDEAREAADVVLLDTAPILAVSDAALLFPEIDGVLVVARAGKTTGVLAERTTELLERLGAPAVWVTLNDTSESAIPKEYQEYSSKSRR